MTTSQQNNPPERELSRQWMNYAIDGRKEQLEAAMKQSGKLMPGTIPDNAVLSRSYSLPNGVAVRIYSLVGQEPKCVVDYDFSRASIE